MINVNELPERIGYWRRKSPNVYLSTLFNGRVAIINTEKQNISFGIYIPAGAHIGDEHVETNEDIIHVLENKFNKK